MKNCDGCTHLKWRFFVTGFYEQFKFGNTIRCKRNHLLKNEGETKSYTRHYYETKGYKDFQREAEVCPDGDFEEEE